MALHSTQNAREYPRRTSQSVYCILHIQPIECFQLLFDKVRQRSNLGKYGPYWCPSWPGHWLCNVVVVVPGKKDCGLAIEDNNCKRTLHKAVGRIADSVGLLHNGGEVEANVLVEH
ncbi:uncharacterized protein BDW43DRAFT_232468 [Aspergillus alliaceus]|uniref:uncharacterized protein n=1 Tax=Petromyces alliaceus TaxID=209559 RepID=UPI0012A4B220|nr:uncharacterized protein BDW43DRAFT_232468 [Aspergillus alliaceus]KAB8228063.1 hypothetical protein BDW43DRAFT_232468 [Aspergillus alliaceus]